MHANEGVAPPPQVAGTARLAPETEVFGPRRLTRARRAVIGWGVEGGRAAVFMSPRWARLDAGPVTLLALMLLGVGLSVAVQRAIVSGPAEFYAPALAVGWLAPLLTAWLCWWAASRGPAARPHLPTPASVLGLLLAKDLLIAALLSVFYLAVLRGWLPVPPAQAGTVLWGLQLGVLGWALLSSAWLVWGLAAHRGWARLAVPVAFVAMGALQALGPQVSFWYPAANAATDSDDAERPAMRLTPELLEAQSAAVVQQLNALAPERPGVVDLYALTFAPYADEDVFSREAAMVGEVMRQRFDAAGRQLRLQNHAGTAAELPWATPLNLRRAIHAAARRMNREEDVLFLHLTSHGARDGQLAASFWPVEVDEVTPQQLRAWLDEAGVRHRVVSISACYSGSWIPLLAEPGTLVMTAADAEHTSYGCGRLSELTFFGRAMYDEQLRRHTLSFADAHAASRRVIAQREKEAGKTDGYSNPQIALGALIGPQLLRLEAQLKDRSRATEARD